jgi:two-component system sensor histidine kinase TrcS
MASLVDELLLLSRLGEGDDLRTEDVDLADIVLNAFNDVAVAAPTHKWVKDLPDDPVWVSGDSDRLHQLVSNLLTNGWVHTPAGVTVTTSITCYRGTSEPPYAELVVANDGPDIDAELLPHLFDRFVRAKHSPHEGGGNGLGLAIVDSVVKAHNGTVTAESGGGRTIFRVRLPLSR